MIFIIPFIEKISKEFECIEMVEFILVINWEKFMEWLKRFSPKYLIEEEILSNKSKNIDKTENEKFIKIPKIINLIMKAKGFSILWKVRCDIKYLI